MALLIFALQFPADLRKEIKYSKKVIFETREKTEEMKTIGNKWKPTHQLIKGWV